MHRAKDKRRGLWKSAVQPLSGLPNFAGETADANGNIGSSFTGYNYDIENRLIQPGSASIGYAYDPGNKRLWRGDTSQGIDEIDFWGGNNKMATYQLSTAIIPGGIGQPSTYAVIFSLQTTNVHFAGKLVSKGTQSAGNGQDWCSLTPVTSDRLGSIGKFYPFGQERPSATTNDTEKFTGYYRDASTGLDYADQRYHQPGTGRFLTPDPLVASAKPEDPGSWNRYEYVGGDPVNSTDPSGLEPEPPPRDTMIYIPSPVQRGQIQVQPGPRSLSMITQSATTKVRSSTTTISTLFLLIIARRRRLQMNSIFRWNGF